MYEQFTEIISFIFFIITCYHLLNKPILLFFKNLLKNWSKPILDLQESRIKTAESLQFKNDLLKEKKSILNEYSSKFLNWKEEIINKSIQKDLLYQQYAKDYETKKMSQLNNFLINKEFKTDSISILTKSQSLLVDISDEAKNTFFLNVIKDMSKINNQQRS